MQALSSDTVATLERSRLLGFMQRCVLSNHLDIRDVSRPLYVVSRPCNEITCEKYLTCDFFELHESFAMLLL
jgi:hypothetical protein